MAERENTDWVTIILAATALFFLTLAVIKIAGGPNKPATVIEPIALHPGWANLLEGPVLSEGPEEAELTLVEFYSYGCGFCQNLEPSLDALRQSYPDRMRRIYIPLHMGAFGSAMVDARAAWCAGEQNAFVRVHERLYLPEEQPRDWEGIARRAGIPKTDEFLACLSSDRYDSVIATSEDQSSDMGVPGVPYLVLNGKAYVGAYPEELLRKLVAQELRLLENENL